jgi:IS30 family transposase
LSLADREESYRGLAPGESLRVIAAGLDRALSTVSREVAGNGSAPGTGLWSSGSAVETVLINC